jgi:predicted RecB family nuclease
MGLRLSASAIKSWFQYRCERQLRYSCADPDELESVPVAVNAKESKWAEFGEDFEIRVVQRLASETSVLRPTGNALKLSDRDAERFLTVDQDHVYAFQFPLYPHDFLARAVPASQSISLKVGYADLIRSTLTPSGQRVLTIVDIKATRNATQFHKIQVAFYSLVLQNELQRLSVQAKVAPDAEIWRLPDPGQCGLWEPQIFPLAAYQRVVLDFLQNKAQAIAAVKLGPGVDGSFFHVYFKCEQCKYLEHCLKAVQTPDLAKRDLSAIPGMSHESKAILQRNAIRTVSGLALAERQTVMHREASWALQNRFDLMQYRAKSQASGQIHRVPEMYSLLMPPRVDLRLFLVVDADPIDNDLLTLGYRRWCLVNGEVQTREKIQVLSSSDPHLEAGALHEVMGAMLEDLNEADTWNRNHEDKPLHAQIFLYEAAEAKNLKEAFGRGVQNSKEVLHGLLDLMRIFPPEEAVPEPEFKGYQHFPATIVRHVVEQLFALPVLVGYDLRQVSDVLHTAPRPTPTVFRPTGDFERQFSSLLPIDVGRKLREHTIEIAFVENDVRCRLQTLQEIVAWLIEENAASTEQFLRLPKQPFRFMRTVHPLDAGDLDVLQAYALLEDRTNMLSQLSRLAQPLARRRSTLRTIDGLRYRSNRQSGRSRIVTFQMPAECRETELGPDSLDLILTQDEPEIRMNPLRWPSHRAHIHRMLSERTQPEIDVKMPEVMFNTDVAPHIASDGTVNTRWVLDEIYQDRTAVRLQRFLASLTEVLPPQETK